MICTSLAEIVAFCGGELYGVCGSEKVAGAETDSRKDLSGSIFFALKGERFDAHDFLPQAIANNAAVMCVQKGKELPPGGKYWIVDDTLKAYQQLGRMMLEKINIPRAAITGSVGKTSVKEMTRAVLEYKFGKGAVLFTEGNTNNHIGVPQNLLRLNTSYKVAVIEMGTSSFGEIGVLSEIVRPDVAVINSVASCHLENLGTLEGVAKEKSAIFDYAKKLAVFPGNIPQSVQICTAAQQKNLQTVRFGNVGGGDIDIYYSDFKGSINGSSFKLHCGDECVDIVWNMQGEHQAQNACAAAAVGRYFNMSFSDIANGLKNTVLPGMRAKIIEYKGAHFYNDAYNANPASMHALLKMIVESVKNGEFAEKDIVLVLGDMLELGECSDFEHRRLLSAAVEFLPTSQVLAIGRNFMRNADDFAVNFFENSVAAGRYLQDIISENKWIFLKGSRSMHVENVLPGDISAE